MRSYFRVLGQSWWSEEMPSDEEYAEAEANLEQAGWSVDCVLAHCLPSSIAMDLDPSSQPDKLTDFLESVKDRCQFSQWFAGHYHTNRVIDNRFMIQWGQISGIDIGTPSGK